MTTTKSTTLGEIRYWTGFVKLYDDGSTSPVGLYAEVATGDTVGSLLPKLDRLLQEKAAAVPMSGLIDYTRPGSHLTDERPHLRIGYAGPDPQAVLDALAQRVDQERAKRQA